MLISVTFQERQYNLDFEEEAFMASHCILDCLTKDHAYEPFLSTFSACSCAELPGITFQGLHTGQWSERQACPSPGEEEG